MRLLVVILLLFPAAVAAETVFEFSVSKSPLSRFESSQTTKIIDRINSILEDRSNGGDRCEHISFIARPFVNIGHFKNSVDVKDDLNALFEDLTHSVYVVEAINYCNGPTPYPVNGCAQKGKPIIVVNLSSLEHTARLWLHEFGHSQGLSQATDFRAHTKRRNSFMNSHPGPSNTAITSTECSFLKSQSVVFAATFNPYATPLIHETAGASSGKRTPLEELLQRLWIHGPPTTELRGVANDAPKQLRELLTDRTKKHLWENAIVALAVLGDENDIEFLVSLFEREKAVDPATENAKLKVTFAVGYLSARFETSAGHRFLRHRTNPNNNIIVFANQNYERSLFLAQEVSKSALKGLALSGSNSESAAVAINEAKLSSERGAYDLGVGEDFFQIIEEIQSDVEEYGLEGFLIKAQ